MSLTVLIAAPMTGSEEFGEARESVQALACFYRAFSTGDLERMAENWHEPCNRNGERA